MASRLALAVDCGADSLALAPVVDCVADALDELELTDHAVDALALATDRAADEPEPPDVVSVLPA